MKSKSLFSALLFSGAMILFDRPGLAVETYFLTDLGPVENTTAEVRINNRGQVLVHHRSLARTLLFDGGQTYDLGAILGLRLFDGFDMNDDGVIVGRAYYESADEWRAVALVKGSASDSFGTNLVELAVLSQGVTPQRAVMSINNDSFAWARWLVMTR